MMHALKIRMKRHAQIDDVHVWPGDVVHVSPNVARRLLSERKAEHVLADRYRPLYRADRPRELCFIGGTVSHMVQ